MSDFETPEEEAVVEEIKEVLRESNEFWEFGDYGIAVDESGNVVGEEYADNGYGGLKVNNTYDIEIKVKRRERISD